MARIYVETEVREFYRELTEKGAARGPLFKTMKDAFMFSFAIGVRNGVRRELTSRVEIFSTDVFDVDRDVPVLQAVFLSESENLRGLNPEPEERVALEIVRLSEEFANAGVQVVLKSYNSVEPEVSLAVLLAVGT